MIKVLAGNATLDEAFDIVTGEALSAAGAAKGAQAVKAGYQAAKSFITKKMSPASSTLSVQTVTSALRCRRSVFVQVRC